MCAPPPKKNSPSVNEEATGDMLAYYVLFLNYEIQF